MTIDLKTVERVAELSRLEFDDSSKEEIKKDLNRILGFIDKLNELDTSNVEPLIFMSDAYNVLREDTEGPSINQDDALKNAPRKDSDYFRVPKVLNK